MNEMKNISDRICQMLKSAIHEMTHLSKKIDDVAFLSWAKSTLGAPEHIRQVAANAITSGLTDDYSESMGLLKLREQIAIKLERDNYINTDPSQIIVTVGAIEGLAAAVMAIR